MVNCVNGLVDEEVYVVGFHDVGYVLFYLFRFYLFSNWTFDTPSFHTATITYSHI